MFIEYFDESKKNIAIDDQKSIVMSYVNEHQMNVGISIVSLYNFLKQNPELKKTATGGQRA
ncbi:MAG: hypothetical protein IKJ28_04245 [Alphaproteobacteria bacterium]|nr:hypothetical protein [Alphaproteobacteria bacterium]